MWLMNNDTISYTPEQAISAVQWTETIYAQMLYENKDFFKDD